MKHILCNKLLAMCVVFVMLAVFAVGCGQKSETESTSESASETEDVTAESEDTAASSDDTVSETSSDGIGIHHVEITVKDYGTISLELDGDTAPVTVQNFLDLASSGFYDGLTFHRIMDGFMIQGGDPNGNGTGGAEQNIVGEFEENGYTNNISHVKGVISMARAKDPNSASSQFFIMVGDADYLDGNYAAFGHVTDGQDIVDQIAADAKPVDGNGTIKPEEQPVIEKITVVD